jgi:hypothetical protein
MFFDHVRHLHNQGEGMSNSGQGGESDPSEAKRAVSPALSIDFDELEEQAKRYHRELVQQGKLVPVGEMREHLLTMHHGASAMHADSMLSVNVDGVDYIPMFYFSGQIDAAVLVEVTELLTPLPGWSKWHFFVSANASLGGITPLEALRKGEFERVRRSAQTHAER